ncbi:MAG: nucleotide exchange factor GrpE [Clostridiaceae bacterium]|nr:nucleotide exchange factor GrpE [Eubacteriales bacterium]
MHPKDDKRGNAAPEKNRNGAAEAAVDTAAQAEPVAEATPEVTMTQAEFLQVKEHIEKLKAERDELVNLVQRTQADFDNFRKRNASVYCDSLEEGLRGLMKELLPVLDNFDRALKSDDESEAWREGVKLVYRQFMGVLEKNGLCEIEACGQFDPELHEAVLRGEEEGKSDGDIIEVLQKGYKVKDRIIRHSMVKVAKE